MKEDIKILTNQAIKLLNDNTAIREELKKKNQATCWVETEKYKLSIEIKEK